MTLLDLLVAVRRRWLTATVVLLLVLLVAGIFTWFTPRTYTASATVGIVPGSSATSLESFGQLANAAPLYAELARSSDVRLRAQQLSDRQLGSLVVRTFRETPLILKVEATASSAIAAQSTADAYVQALQEASDQGAVLPADQVVVRLFSAPNLPSSPSAPKVRLILVVAVLVGLVLGTVAAVWREAAAPR